MPAIGLISLDTQPSRHLLGYFILQAKRKSRANTDESLISFLRIKLLTESSNGLA